MTGESVEKDLVSAAPPEDAPPDGQPSRRPDCPVTPLGHRDGVFYVLSPSGQKRELPASQLRDGPIEALFEGHTAWLRSECPQGENGWSWRSARSWLIGQCGKVGIFDPDTPVRGRGVWRDGAGALIVHCGGDIMVEGDWRKAGFVHDGAIYAAAARVARPASSAAEAAVGQSLLRDIKRWRFKTPRGGDLVLGWIGAALYGGAPDWRPHMFTTGPTGCGKSTLALLVQAALGGQAHPSSNNVTEAGLRQFMTGDARAIVIDEAEHEAEGGRVMAVIELLRHMSGGIGATTRRGSAAGRAQAYSVTGCAYLSSILHVPLSPQDRSRIACVRLDQLDFGPQMAEARSATQARIKATAEASAALRARAVRDWPRFNDLLGVYRKALLRASSDTRQADQLGTLLAGRDLLIRDDVPSDHDADELVLDMQPLLSSMYQDDEEESEGLLCLNHLLTSPVDLWESGQRRTVSRAILDEMDMVGARRLGAIGLRLAKDANGVRWLLVANKHVGLERIFRGTRWANGVWRQALGDYLPGARSWGSTARFDGISVRATAIPESFIPSENKESDGDL